MNAEGTARLSKDILLNIFSTEKIIDYVDYNSSSKTLTITRNPYGFENKISATTGYKGVHNEAKENRNGKKDIMGNTIMEERGTISDTDFIKRIVK